VAVAAFLVCSAICSPGEGQQGDRERDLDAIRSDISRLEFQLAKVQTRREDAAGRIAEVDLELELQETRLAEAATRREMASAGFADARLRTETLRVEMAGLRTRLKKSLLGLYRMGRYGYVRLFLEIRTRSGLLPGIRVLRFLVQRDLHNVGLLKSAAQELSAELENLALQRAEFEEWEARELKRKNDLTAVRRRHSTTLSQVEREMGSLSRSRLELQTRERKLAGLLEYLAERIRTPLSDREIQKFRGVLDWPAKGDVLRGFGPQLDPRYGTKVPHNGLDIGTDSGATVRTVYPGEVAFAEPFPGYGPTVIVLHSGQVFSLYAGLSELRVGSGDVLSSEEVLGRSKGSFYFEIRVQNQPEDPLLWLR